MLESRCLQGIWSSPLIFIFAASGSAIGLGNIWKFPYMVGENGGGAFLFIYCLCLLLVGLPMLIAEVALGRTVRSNPIDTINDLADRKYIHKNWVVVPWVAGSAGALILTFYSVIAGWAFAYAQRSIVGDLRNLDETSATTLFDQLLSSPVELLFWHSVFMALVVLTVGQSVIRGLANVVRLLLPTLILLMLVLAVFSFMNGDYERALHFLTRWNWQDLSFDVALSAIGHALFSLGVGMGAMFAYGAYMNKRMSILKACTIVAGLDLFVSVLASVVIFPLVFAFGLDVQSGPSLPFISLPIIFSALPAGQFVAILFFVLLILAALTSAISMMELFVSWLHERYAFSRLKAATFLGAGIWLAGVPIALTFSNWDSKLLFGRNLFELIDDMTSFVMLPVAAIALSILVAWYMPTNMLRNEQIVSKESHYRWWYNVLKFVSIPVMIFLTLAGWIGD